MGKGDDEFTSTDPYGNLLSVLTNYSSALKSLAFFLAPGPCWRAVKKLCQTLFQKLTAAWRDRLELVLTVMALRHQLAVLERSGKRPHFSPADRCFWALLSTVWVRWSTALTIVHADTVRRWKRQGVRHHLAWQRRRQRPGRPALAAETRMLIRRISWENRLWGAPRLHGELAKLGICLSRTTVAKYMASPKNRRNFLR
jgi:hypothetical protein